MHRTTQRRHRAHAAVKGAGQKTYGPPWQIQTAKARFSELFRQARSHGPQRITRQGKEGVVMLSDEDFERLLGRSQPKSIVQFFQQSPLVGVELNLERDKDEAREMEL